MRLIRLMLLPILAITFAACGVLREPEEPSAPIEAIPLAVATATAEPVAAADSLTADQAVAEAESAGGELLIYRISQEESQVRFELGEDLRGVRTAVAGVTDQVAGEVAVNLSDLTSAQVGIIQIYARGLATDNNFRNRAIHNDILRTATYEFITFTPTALGGLPAAAAPGEDVRFTIDGDLTIRDITRPVTFDVTATTVTADRLVGTATASVNRVDFDLRIPSVPSVANVDEVVRLTIDFVAEAMS
jgi:polyisoprenoid-binding protein YceI